MKNRREGIVINASAIIKFLPSAIQFPCFEKMKKQGNLCVLHDFDKSLF